ncbi:hypothetical protein [Kiritimatiella glycovorans]|uniref:Uncharacterized protein n=1 Tax=Kiritimatiella glycovorans TaxID=1307763 RepID=A0A0G3EFL0_9BACT|nr:hypothetical protein [Kiritimatiella glycovorans]AKJ63585.1 hypothetical protein L21SP4_00304 [Kiritimatiella glycovorans]
MKHSPTCKSNRSAGLRVAARAALGGMLLALCTRAEEPALPPGLGGGGNEGRAEEPALPSGLSSGGQPAPAAEPEDGGGPDKPFKLPFEWYGFWETRIGSRLQNDPHTAEDLILGETRLQLAASKRLPDVGFNVVADFLYDEAAEEVGVELDRGEGWIDLREANVLWSPRSDLDLKIGRQVLTWGTGDMLFINDNFPKDWRSYFIGRDEEYLKAPSDAVKASWFNPVVNVDLVYTPKFDHDRYIDGQRVSVLDPPAGEDAVMDAVAPDEWLDNDEIAFRLHRMFGRYETALYGYDGYWKSPGGQRPDGRMTFPRLAVWGASVRGPLAGGIGNFETGYYDSKEDRGGDDPRVNNSEWRVLAGYERDLKSVASDFTVGLQYYVEWMQDHEDYLSALPAGAAAREEDRHVATVRLTKLLMRQTVELSLFTYWSPTDHDLYARPYAGWDLTDQWKIEAGGNLFLGEDDHTFFGRFERNSNLYAALRYSF